MPIAVVCTSCGKTHTVPDAMAGRTGKCRCGAVLKVPAPPGATTAQGARATDDVVLLVPVAEAVSGPPPPGVVLDDVILLDDTFAPASMASAKDEDIEEAVEDAVPDAEPADDGEPVEAPASPPTVAAPQPAALPPPLAAMPPAPPPAPRPATSAAPVESAQRATSPAAAAPPGMPRAILVPQPKPGEAESPLVRPVPQPVPVARPAAPGRGNPALSAGARLQTHVPPLPSAAPAATEEERWYYAQGDVQLGPVTLSELQRLARTGTLAPTDRVWKQGLAQWVAVAQVPALRAGAGTSGIEPPPLLLSAATAEDELRLAPAPDARHATQAVRRWGNVQPPPAIGLHKRRPKRSRTLRRTSSVVPAIIVVLLLAVLGGIGVFAVTRSSDAGSAGGGGTRVTFRVSGPPQSAIVMHRPGQARGSAGVFIEVPWEKTAVLDTPDSANVIMLVRNASMVTAEVEVNGRVWKSLASPNTLGGGYLIQGVIER